MLAVLLFLNKQKSCYFLQIVPKLMLAQSMKDGNPLMGSKAHGLLREGSVFRVITAVSQKEKINKVIKKTVSSVSLSVLIRSKENAS